MCHPLVAPIMQINHYIVVRLTVAFFHGICSTLTKPQDVLVDKTIKNDESHGSFKSYNI